MHKQTLRNPGEQRIELGDLRQVLTTDMRFHGSEIRRVRAGFSIDLFIRGVATVAHISEFLDYRLLVIMPGELKLSLPVVIDKAKSINRNFEHVNANNTLCIASEIDLRNLMNTPRPVKAFFDCILGYLVQYEYWTRYKTFLVKPRSHGTIGMLESYQELFGVQEVTKILELMRLSLINNLDLSRKCPCESGISIEACHYSTVKLLHVNQTTQLQTFKDWRDLANWMANLRREVRGGIQFPIVKINKLH